MGFRDFDQAEIERVLGEERVIRIAFAADGELYVAPVFYVWHEGALCGLTTPGRKTELAAANPDRPWASRGKSGRPAGGIGCGAVVRVKLLSREALGGI